MSGGQRDTTRCILRMFRLVPLDSERLDPVARADMRTSLNDARTALCIAMGVPLDLIDAASGHSLSRE